MRIARCLLAGTVALAVSPSVFAGVTCQQLYNSMLDSCLTQYQTCVRDGEPNCAANRQQCDANAEAIYQHCIGQGGGAATTSLQYQEMSGNTLLSDTAGIYAARNKPDSTLILSDRTSLLPNRPK